MSEVGRAPSRVGLEPAVGDGRDARAWGVGSEQDSEIQVWSCWHRGSFGTCEVTAHQGVSLRACEG